MALPYEKLIQHMRDELPEPWADIGLFCEKGVPLEPYLKSIIDVHRRCSSCGYDLFGGSSGVCPECGALGLSTFEERAFFSFLIWHRMRWDFPEIWEQVRAQRLAELDVIHQELARARDEARKEALRRYLEHVQSLEEI